MDIEFVEPSGPAVQAGTVTALLSFLGLDLAADASQLDAASQGKVTSIARDHRFDGANEQICELGTPLGEREGRVLLVGLGPRPTLDLAGMEDAGARARSAAERSNAVILEIRLSDFSANEAAHVALGVVLSSYRFDRYRTTRNAARVEIGLLRVITADPISARTAMLPLTALANGIHLARDLVSEPANVLYPEAFAERLSELGVNGLVVTVIGEAELERAGMKALLAVGQGSPRESRMVICEWRGASDREASPIAVIGKGVTFDSGGLSIKPAKDMELMKSDMGGAASVAGLMLTLAERRARVNVVGVFGLVENMPDGNAFRPGDVVTSMSGQTIEIINTDAEGRLVLADTLWYAQTHFKLKALLDVATLTGFISYALGDDYAGLFSNDDALAEALLTAGRGEGELLWRLPLEASYDKLHDSLIADMKNVGGHPEAGAITAGLFLQRFVRDIPWAHLDIASVAWRERKDKPTIPQGATGYGVRLLNRLIADFYEENLA